MRLENPFRVGFIATLGVLAALVLGGMIASLSTVITYIGVALFLALGFEPLIGFLERRRWPRSLAMLTSVTVVFGILALLIWAMVPSVTEQVNTLTDRYTVIVQDIVNSNVIEWANQTFPALQVEQAVNDGLLWLRDNIGIIGGGVLQVGVSIVSSVFGMLIVFILTLYFVSSMNSIKRVFYQLTPASGRARVADLTEQITGSVGKYVMGQTLLGVINGVLTFILLSAMGAALPAVCALVAFLGSLIPLVGTLSASVIIVLSQLLMLPSGTNTWWILAIYYVVYMQVEAYFISPRVMASAVKVPGPIVVVAALTGGTLLGLLGALVAIPVAAAILLIVRQVVIPAQNER
ncbi:AI-2E family transporter [Pseudoclavibacter endophyticus]|uniref:AI-2E family transporter n=1 Tax=Pseudoclavibacter endophyticus TaxID=1778590 RepID=A0A6H9WKE2_9MICO|nr:AI-2E family transporter [Pseudoclavibacter endophyticus]KAB1647902.1 AI-2E family transporter [Pseudoclavibacter endophyticus]GGA73773.1 AI-2E family transporter [Pseudoclavibacter endophyticus]